jgi:hypothetical protein
LVRVTFQFSETAYGFAELEGDRSAKVLAGERLAGKVDAHGRIFGVNRHRIRAGSTIVTGNIGVAGRCHGHRAGGFNPIAGRERGGIGIAVNAGEVAQGSTADAHITVVKTGDIFAEFKAD